MAVHQDFALVLAELSLLLTVLTLVLTVLALVLASEDSDDHDDFQPPGLAI